MENGTTEKSSGFCAVIRKWRVGDYIRQLSVVVIGILITVQSSAWIDRNHKRKEAREILVMVREELNTSLRHAQYMDTWSQKELTAMDFFSRHMDDILSAPADSLLNCAGFLVNVQLFSATPNALQVLTTSASSNVIDKKLLNNIFSSYDYNRGVVTELNFIADEKAKIITSFFYNQDKKVIQSFLTGEKENMYPFLTSYFKDPRTSSYVVSSEASLGGKVGKIKALIAALENTIIDIDNYIN